MLATVFTLVIYLFFVMMLKSIHAIVNNVYHNLTVQLILFSVFMGILFFHYAT